MGLLKEAFFGESSNERAMNDAKWMLCFMAGNVLLIGLVRAIFSLEQGLIPVLIGAAFLIPALVPVYFLRLGAFIVITGLLWVDFVMRHNLFSIVYSLIGVYHVYLLIRWRPEAKKEGAAS
jgi:hypothetical protein